MWSISSNIQHLTQQHGQLKIKWSMLWKRMGHVFQQGNTANRSSYPYDNVSLQMMERPSSRPKGSIDWEHCAAYGRKRSFRGRNDENCTFQAMMRMRNGFRIMRIERPLWEESKFKMQRPQLCKSRKIWEMLKRQDQQPEKELLGKMVYAIGDSLSDLATSDDEEDREHEADDEEFTMLSNLREDDEPGREMGTISKTQQLWMERFRHKHNRLDELTQPGWEDAADYFCDRDMKNGTAELRVPAVVNPPTDKTEAIPSPATFRELMQTVDIVPGQSLMPQWTSPPRFGQTRLGSDKPQSYTCIASFPPDMEPYSSQNKNSNPVETVILYLCIECP